MTLVGAAVLLPCLAFVGGPRVTTDPVALAWLVYLGALTMALAYVLLYSGLRVVAPSTAVIASLVEPVTAAVVAAVVLQEPLGPVRGHRDPAGARRRGWARTADGRCRAGRGRSGLEACPSSLGLPSTDPSL